MNHRTIPVLLLSVSATALSRHTDVRAQSDVPVSCHAVLRVLVVSAGGDAAEMPPIPDPLECVGTPRNLTSPHPACLTNGRLSNGCHGACTLSKGVEPGGA